MSQVLFPLDSADASWVIRGSDTESPEEAAAMGDLALYHEVPLSGSCKYMQPLPKFLPETGTGLLVGNRKLCSLPKCWISGCGRGWLAGWLCGVRITHPFRDLTVTER